MTLSNIELIKKSITENKQVPTQKVRMPVAAFTHSTPTMNVRKEHSYQEKAQICLIDLKDMIGSAKLNDASSIKYKVASFDNTHVKVTANVISRQGLNFDISRFSGLQGPWLVSTSKGTGKYLQSTQGVQDEIARLLAN